MDRTLRNVMKQPLVTVVVPTCNREGFLMNALRSLLTQDYDAWEAIVVNDGGNAVDALARSLDSRGRIRCVDHFASLGPAAARNTALRLARGEVICYLDDDDMYCAHHLSTIVQAMQETGAPFVYTDCETLIETAEDGVRHVHERREIRGLNRDFSRAVLHVANYIPINTWGHHRDCLLKSGFFDESLRSHEDWDFLIRMARHFEFQHVPKLTVEVRVRKDAVDSVTMRQLHECLDVYRLIYKRYTELAAQPAVRRGRWQCLAELAERERTSLRAGVKRTALLCSAGLAAYCHFNAHSIGAYGGAGVP